MSTRIGVPIIEFYGSTLRYGIEGKWVEWIALKPGEHRPTRREILALITEEDRRHND